MWRDILSSPVPSAKNAWQSHTQIWYCCKLKRVNTYNLIKITQQLLYFNYCKNKSICSTSEVVYNFKHFQGLILTFPVCNFPSFSFLHKWKSFAPQYGKVDLGWLCHLIFLVRSFRLDSFALSRTCSSHFILSSLIHVQKVHFYIIRDLKWPILITFW